MQRGVVRDVLQRQDVAQLGAETARIAEELNHQYLIGYAVPHASDGQYHSIRVRITGGEYRVRARNGYVATPIPKKKGS